MCAARSAAVALALSLSLAAATDCVGGTCSAGQDEEASLLQHAAAKGGIAGPEDVNGGNSGPSRGVGRRGDEEGPPCLTQEDVDATIQAFMQAVPALSPLKSNCTQAKTEAQGVIATAYAYGVPDVTVQFKPTLTVAPYVYRPTAEGALSYFIGPCVCPGAVDIESASMGGTCGVSDGYFAPDAGFAFGPDFTGWKEVTYGGTAKGGEEGTNFWYNLGGKFCHNPTAQGPLCFTPEDGSAPTCVDKTFGFVPNPDPNGALKALLSTHHSSAQM